jgi:hypothetical protein
MSGWSGERERKRILTGAGLVGWLLGSMETEPIDFFRVQFELGHFNFEVAIFGLS